MEFKNSPRMCKIEIRGVKPFFVAASCEGDLVGLTLFVKIRDCPQRLLSALAKLSQEATEKGQNESFAITFPGVPAVDVTFRPRTFGNLTVKNSRSVAVFLRAAIDNLARSALLTLAQSGWKDLEYRVTGKPIARIASSGFDIEQEDGDDGRSVYAYAAPDWETGRRIPIGATSKKSAFAEVEAMMLETPEDFGIDGGHHGNAKDDGAV
jgi:hypothetical protein